VRAGIIGRGSRLAPLLQEAGLDYVLHLDASTGEVPGVVVNSYAGFVEALEHPRLFLLDLDPGPAVDKLIDTAYTVMEPGDLVVDLTGSYWGDTLRRYRRMRHRSLFYLDAAFIPGPRGSRLLLAGDERALALSAPLLSRLAGEGGLIVAGGAGAAHYGLMLHEAWRTALNQAASEVHQAIEAFPNGARSEILEIITQPAASGPSDRAAWLLDDAVRLEAATPLLAQAVMLEIATALEELRTIPPPQRVGPFVHPDELL
jgi:6-phosphogluconate dehydrogenase